MYRIVKQQVSASVLIVRGGLWLICCRTVNAWILVF